MTCRELSAVLVDHRSRNLTRWVRVSIALHAALCPCCRAMVATYGLTVDLSGDLGDAVVPDAVAREVEALLARVVSGELAGEVDGKVDPP